MTTEKKEIDTINYFIVGSQGEFVRIMRPVGFLTKEQCLNLAAYLVVCSMSDLEDFTEVYHAIIKS